MLNTTVPECSGRLSAALPGPEERFFEQDKESLDEICVPTCRDALAEFRTKALVACNTTKDAVAFQYAGIIFPPTCEVDLMLLAYDFHCYKDRNTGEYCDVLLTKLRTRRDSHTPMECEDCILERRRRELEAPIRYNKKDALAWASATSACGATGYEYVTPTQYGTPVSGVYEELQPTYANMDPDDSFNLKGGSEEEDGGFGEN